MHRNKSHRILVIDDEPSNIEIIIKSLQKSNYDVIVASDGESGFHIAEISKPSLIITDWDMPGLSGIDTIKRIRSHEDLKHIPIIMATGKKLESTDLKVALEAGADDYIRKPIDKIELLARTRSMIHLYETQNINLKLQKEIHTQKELALTAELEQQKKELAFSTLKLLQQSKFSIDIIESLNEASKYSDEEGQKILIDIVNKCKISNNQSYWDEFEMTFKQVHKNFYEKLNKQHADLTKNERKLAAFLKLNMSSKEIAVITFQSESSLKKARNRLRKKLNIASDIRLCDFFQYL